jgi:hypothetical protein
MARKRKQTSTHGRKRPRVKPPQQTITFKLRRILVQKHQDIDSASQVLIEPFMLKPDQREALLRIIGASEVSDQDWAILEIAEGGFRRVVRGGWVIEHEQQPASKQITRSLRRVAKAAQSLRHELLNLPQQVANRLYLGLLGGGALEHIDRFAIQFNKHLDALSGCSEKRSRVPWNADNGRDEAWGWAASVYERVTRRAMGTVERRDREGKRLEPDNPSIRFIKAFTEACGAPVPSGDVVNGWIKKYLEGRPLRRRGRPAIEK